MVENVLKKNMRNTIIIIIKVPLYIHIIAVCTPGGFLPRSIDAAAAAAASRIGSGFKKKKNILTIS